MKKISVLFLIGLLFFSYQSYSQDTLRLFSRQKHEHRSRYNQHEFRTLSGHNHSLGFSLGLHSNYSQIADYDAITLGGRFTLIANHSMGIGIAGNGFFTDPYKTDPSSSTSHNYAGGYGGLFIEPIIFPMSAVHVSFPVIFGAGGISKNIIYNDLHPHDDTEIYSEKSDAFVIVEPGMELELNVARWFRFAVGCTYRFTGETESSDFDKDQLDGWTTGCTLKFGSF
jgi:hypothetical protein